MSFLGINHVVLKVQDLTASDRFYREILGLERVGKRPGMRFYRAGGGHHDLAIIQSRAAVAGADSRLFHFCFDVESEAELSALYSRLEAAGVRILGSVDHVVMKSFYVADPDGNVVEFGFDVPQSEWRSEVEPFATDRPYHLPLSSVP